MARGKSRRSLHRGRQLPMNKRITSLRSQPTETQRRCIPENHRSTESHRPRTDPRRKGCHGSQIRRGELRQCGLRFVQSPRQNDSRPASSKIESHAKSASSRGDSLDHRHARHREGEAPAEPVLATKYAPWNATTSYAALPTPRGCHCWLAQQCVSCLALADQRPPLLPAPCSLLPARSSPHSAAFQIA